VLKFVLLISLWFAPPLFATTIAPAGQVVRAHQLLVLIVVHSAEKAFPGLALTFGIARQYGNVELPDVSQCAIVDRAADEIAAEQWEGKRSRRCSYSECEACRRRGDIQGINRLYYQNVRFA
jgi:hypothetical protein